MTSDEQRLIAEYGFLHATGARIYLPERSGSPDVKSPRRIGANLHLKELGTWGSRRGIVAVVTEGRKVFLGAGSHPDPRNHDRTNLIARLCPKGQGTYPIGRNGEAISIYDEMRRRADPMAVLSDEPENTAAAVEVSEMASTTS